MVLGDFICWKVGKSCHQTQKTTSCGILWEFFFFFSAVGKKLFAALSRHLANELIEHRRDLTKLGSLQEMMQGMIAERWKGQTLSKTLANDVANCPNKAWLGEVLTQTKRRE